MKKNKATYKILVLSDLKNAPSTLLKSTANLAKMIYGDIQLFYVKKPTEVIEKDNQLSANRTLNQEYNVTEKKIQNLINPISKDYGVNINYSYSFGNVKNEIDKYIAKYQPDIIVLGKRKSKALNLVGDRITDFVLKKYPGVILITDNQNSLEPNNELSLGVLNGTKPFFNNELVEGLVGYAQKPIKSFKILKPSNILEETEIATDKKTVEYVFEHNDNTIKNLCNYISKNNINLLCIDRGHKNNKNKTASIMADINEVIKNLNVSILVTSEQSIRSANKVA